MKRSLLTLAAIASAIIAHADPQLTSWYTADSGQYARIYQTTAAETAYTLFRSSALNYGTWLPVSGATFVDEGATVALTDPAASATTLFYRVMVQQ